MDCCHFNSCILNDTDFLNKYKKKFTKLDGKLSKKIFEVLDITDELIVSLNIDSVKKTKYIFCNEHYNHLKQLKEIKEAIYSKPDKIPKDILISLNNILKNNLDIKKLIYKMEFNKGANIIKILLNNININKDKDIKLYLYLILGHFLKEKIDIISDKENLEKNAEELNHRDKEIFEILNKEIFNLKLKLYDLGKNKINAEINDENFFRDVILYNLCLSNIEHIIYNWNKDQDLLNPKQLIENTIDILNQILSGDDEIPYAISNELFFHIIGILNTYLISNLKEPDLINYIIKFILEKNQLIYVYLKKYKEENKFKSTIRNFITILNTILDILLTIDLGNFDKNQLDVFVINSAEFNKDKKYELFFYRNNDMINELKDKIRLTLNNKSN
jgi:hypothetical protein